MNRLDIQLPVLNEDWIEQNQADIELNALDFFDMTSVGGWAFDLGSDDFEDKFENRKSSQITNYHHGCDEYVYYNIPKYARNIFEEYGIWNKKINTEELVESYNEAIIDLCHHLAFNVALSWAVTLGCEIKEDHGVRPYSKESSRSGQ